MPPPSSDVVVQSLEGQLQVLHFGTQVRQELIVRWERLMMFHIVRHAQGCVQGLKHLGSLGVAAPLPPCVDPLRVQDRVWSQQESMEPGA